jgi:hypothetical protein
VGDEAAQVARMRHFWLTYALLAPDCQPPSALAAMHALRGGSLAAQRSHAAAGPSGRGACACAAARPAPRRSARRCLRAAAAAGGAGASSDGAGASSDGVETVELQAVPVTAAAFAPYGTVRPRLRCALSHAALPAHAPSQLLRR